MPHPPLAGLREPSAVPPERAAQAPRPPGREDIPNLRAMPLDFRVKVPDIRINLHAYSPLPAERFAIIDMKKYRAGDHLPSGVVVREIREESVVMELDGSKFKVPRP
jgi:general secretion pathway protein B